jgi:hypothetical protein
MNREKMHKLALFLEDLDSDRFNIGYWVSQSQMWNSELDFVEGYSLDTNICNTAGCIAGWAVALENNGKISIVEYLDEDDDGSDYCNACDDYHQINNCPKGYTLIDLGNIQEIASDILGLDRRQSERLFIPDRFSVWNQYASDYGLECSNLYVHYTNIHPKHAADMIYRILNGEVNLDEQWNPDSYDYCGDDL